MSAPRIVLHEVGPRDGLQMEPGAVPLALKEAWIREVMASGIDIVQVGSFVRPDKVPQMADTDTLVRDLSAGEPARAVLSALVLNEQGLERALACGVQLLCMGASASETHSRRNSGMSADEALRRVIAMARRALDARVPVQVSVQSAFGCGFEGPIPEARVVDIARAYVDAGLTRLSLADTAGHATPSRVERLFDTVLRLAPDVECTAHFHDTYGLGMANVFAALRVGVTTFETSFGGLGGCPFTRLAAGNVATEDVVHALQREGLRADVDLARLVAVARAVAQHFGRELPGTVYKTGGLTARSAA
jgi:hydroxymethylglutaryl-CoA lyase